MFDVQVKKRLKNGDPSAYKEVFRLLYPRLKGYCRLFISDEHEAEDIIQEGFLTLWEKRNTIQPENSVENLLFVMVRNRCLNRIKKQKLEEVNADLETNIPSENQFLYQIDFSGKEDKSLEELMIESFQQAVDELPEKMQFVYKKCKIEGRKQKEIAEELGVTVKAIEKHISKAKHNIRQKLLLQYPSMVLLISLLIGNLK
ncbi:RNA polymerase sigma-70 factor [Maribellus comscasis]|uniref:RNA polymerase sigma-70 factor n=1 Tax=Maribellus comscasis TaxID=2681766 RepID=A0A6I6JX92_9BACT|nr:RNA polymerase sigma-70 factor [Maribellus comscasis]QGY44797.1 RNA polymerase sigma-70 factor [Maribellus comscasis]